MANENGARKPRPERRGAAAEAGPGGPFGAAQGAVPLEQIVQANQKAFAAATRMNAKVMREMMRVQLHMLGFVSRRIEQDMAAADALARCDDGPEVMAVAQEFCAKAVSDYAEEAQELMRLGVEAASAAAPDPAAARVWAAD